MNLKQKTCKIILGTVQFGLDYGINNKTGKIAPKEAFRILDYAKQMEFHGLDTAAAYGNSEQVIGEYVLKSGLDNLKIITKFDLKAHTSVSESISKSLQKLHIDSAEIVFFHNYSDYSKHKNAVGGGNTLPLTDLGVSVYTNEELESVLTDENINCIQLPFNLLDNASLREKLLLRAKAYNKKILTRSVFLQGLFFMKSENLPQKLVPLTSYLDQIKSIASETGRPIEVLALQYVLSKSYIDYVLIGVDSLEQLKTNIELLSDPIDESVFARIDAIHVDQPELLNPSLWNLQ